MGHSLLVGARVSSTLTTNFQSCGNANILPNTEVERQVKSSKTGALKFLGALVDSSGTSRVIKNRINGADGTGVVTITNGASGVQADTTDSDPIAPSDLFCVGTTVGTNGLVRWFRQVFFTSVNNVTWYLRLNGGTPNSTTGVQYYRLGGTTTPTFVESGAVNCRMRVAGTASLFQVYIDTNSRSSDSIFTSRLNQAAGNLTVTIPAATTGRMEDTTHSDTIAAGDLYGTALELTVGTGSIVPNLFGMQFESSEGAVNDIFCTNDVARSASGTASYFGVTGRLEASGTESDLKIQAGFPVTLSRFRCYVTINTCAATVTATVRKNAANGNGTFGIPAATTGEFEDTSNSDTFAATDDAAISVVGGTTGSLTLGYFGFRAHDDTIAPSTATGATLLMMGV